MVRHHVLIGLGFKRQNFRNRALKYMIDKKVVGNGNPMQLAVMPPSYSRPQIGRGPLPTHRAPLKFNY
jgi:hypothetical protein